MPSVSLARPLPGWIALLAAVAALGAAEAFLAYEFGPAVALLLPIAAAVAAVIVWRPIYGVYAGILCVPLEVLAVSVGSEAGLSPAEAVLLLTAMVAIVHLVTSGATVPDPAHLWFAALIGVAFLGLFYAEDTFVVAKIAVMWSAFLVVSLFVASRSFDEIQRVLGCLVLMGGIVGVLAVAGAGDQQLVAGGEIATNRAQGSFAHPNVLAFALILAIPPAFVLALTARQSSYRALSLAAGTAAVAGLALSLSRGGLVGGAVALAVLLAWPRFRRYAFVLLTMLAIFAAFNLSSIQDSTELSLVGARVGTLASEKGLRENPRVNIWTETPGIVIDNPFIGVGEGNYSNASPDYGVRDVGGLPFDHAHNLLLTIVAELGLIGLFLFMAFMFATGRAGARALRDKEALIYPPALAIVAAMTGLLVTSIGEYPLRTNAIMALILIQLGALIGYGRVREQVGARDVL